MPITHVPSAHLDMPVWDFHVSTHTDASFCTYLARPSGVLLAGIQTYGAGMLGLWHFDSVGPVLQSSNGAVINRLGKFEDVHSKLLSRVFHIMV